MAKQFDCDVIIVGLGPTGALLANLLGQQGWSVVGLEREEDLYYAPRAVHFDDEIMRVFQHAGLCEEISRSSEPFRDMEITLKPRGKPVLHTLIGNQDLRFGHAGAWWFHQPTLEKHFQDGMKRFARLTPIYGAEVQKVEQDEDGATVTATTRDGGTRSLRGRYVIGCDGGRSFVRREAGLALDTADFDEAWVVVDTVTRTGRKHPDLPPCHRQTCDPKQPVTYVPLAGPYYEFQFMVMGDKTEREATDAVLVRQQLRDFVDLDTIDITRIAYYKFHALWAKKWRNGRVILAGDSAHQMPPFLGQGMCSGVRDAISLSWRLDLVLQGKAADSLIDHYEAERSAHVQHIIRGAMFLGNVIQTRNRAVAFLRNNLLFRPANAVPLLNRFFYSVANRKRPLETGFFGRNRRRLAGTLALQPRVSRADGAAVLLDEVLGRGFAILARRGGVAGQGAAIATLRRQVQLPLKVVEFCTATGDECVGDAQGTLHRWFGEHDIDFVLIRPDRYIFDAGRAGELEAVLKQLAQQYPGTSSSRFQLENAA